MATNTDNRKVKGCPKCGFHLLARTGDNKIFCLNNGCEWFTDAKRNDDTDKIPEIHILKDMWK